MHPFGMNTASVLSICIGFCGMVCKEFCNGRSRMCLRNWCLYKQVWMLILAGRKNCRECSSSSVDHQLFNKCIFISRFMVHVVLLKGGMGQVQKSYLYICDRSSPQTTKQRNAVYVLYFVCFLVCDDYPCDSSFPRSSLITLGISIGHAENCI